jgi:hypothetical protein
MPQNIYPLKITTFRLSCCAIFMGTILFCVFTYINERAHPSVVEGLDLHPFDAISDFASHAIDSPLDTLVHPIDNAMTAIEATTDDPTGITSMVANIVRGDQTFSSPEAAAVAAAGAGDIGIPDTSSDYVPPEVNQPHDDVPVEIQVVTGMCSGNDDSTAEPDVQCTAALEKLVINSSFIKGRNQADCCEKESMCSGNVKSTIGLDFPSTENPITYQYDCDSARSFGNTGNTRTTIDVKKGMYKIDPVNRIDPGCPRNGCTQAQDRLRHDTCCVVKTCADILCDKSNAPSTQTLDEGELASKTTCCEFSYITFITGETGVIWVEMDLQNTWPVLLLIPFSYLLAVMFRRYPKIASLFILIICSIVGALIYAPKKWKALISENTGYL